MTTTREVPLEQRKAFGEFLELLKQDSEGAGTFGLAMEALNKARDQKWT